MPRELTLEQIKDILARGAISEFLDVLESEFVEFKAEPYRLDNDDQKVELAKDVSAFANTLGGFIVLGVKTTRVPEYNADVASELSPIPRDLVDPERYQNIARDWIYPPINELRIGFVPDAGAADKGFFVLEVSGSLAVGKPFLIVKSTDEHKKKDRRITFGYAERFRSSSLAVVVQRLQQLLHLGIRLESHESFQQGLETRLAGLQTGMERLEAAVLKQVHKEETTLQTEREREFTRFNQTIHWPG